MKLFTNLFCCLLLLSIAINLPAQTLEFVENKGQWDKRVKYEGNMGAATFYLQPQGYRVLLNSPKDLTTISEFFGGHGVSGNISKLQNKSHENGDNTKDKLTLHSHAYQVTFVGSSPNASITPDKPINSYNNYFLGIDSTKWATNCKIYNAVTYKNIYPNVDARYYTDAGKLKYDIIIRPGGDANKIMLQFDGVDGLSVKNGNLIVNTSMGDVTELEPLCYQLNAAGRSTVNAKYVISGNTVRFQLGNYSRTSTLVIDPALIFASFAGSISDNWGYTATYDIGGNFYGGGIVFGNEYPVSLGAFDETYNGGDGSEGGNPYDIGIIKLSPNGASRLYATYIGGNGDEQPHSLVTDGNGNLIIAGRTTSLDFPVTNPTYGSGGGFDIFIAKLNSTGTALLGSRKFGGSGSDGVNIRPKYIPPEVAEATRRNYGDDARSEVIVDAAGNIYLASCTQSPNFPTTAGAFQTTYGGGRQDGIIIKANVDISNVLFSTFIGGSNDDAAFVLTLNPLNNDILVGGGTVSNNLNNTGGTQGPILFNSNQGGECDGFIALISNDGNILRRTRYVGGGGNDLVYGVQFDKFGFPYITGTTTSSLPVVRAAFNQQDKGKQFITKMKTDLSEIIYNTNFGKGQSLPDISPTAFLVDRCENVYVSGWGGGINKEYIPAQSTSGLSVTANANGIVKTVTDGSDFYFFVLKKDATAQLFGGFYGNDDSQGGIGDHVDGGTSRFDKQGIIYQGMCANCGHAGFFPTTPGVWARTNISTTDAGCNQALVKIAFELAGVGSNIQSAIGGVPRDSLGCVPLTVDFNDTVRNAQKYIWDFGDGSPRITTTIPFTSYTFNNVGIYRVMLISIDSTTCNISDTSFITIHARDDKALISFDWLKLPPCDSLKYQFTNTSTSPPRKPFTNQSFQWVFGDGTTLISNAPTIVHNYTAPGTYTIVLRLIDTSYCNSPDSVSETIRIAVNVVAQFETPPFGCVPYNALFNNTSLAGQQFFWDFGDGSPIDNSINPAHLYTIPGTYTIHLLAIDDNTCNKTDDTTFTIVVSPKPIAAFSFTPIPAEENTFTNFFNLSSGGTHYKWDFGDGDTLKTIQRDTIVKHIYNISGVFNVCLTTYNEYGCDSTVCHPVQSIIFPLLDIPNAFTPNGDGVNDMVFLRGFGITQMNWRIYNRWGTLVFQSTSPSKGWDGYYRGVLQPQEVYVYVLDVSYSDKTKYQKKGDITLLR